MHSSEVEANSSGTLWLEAQGGVSTHSKFGFLFSLLSDTVDVPICTSVGKICMFSNVLVSISEFSLSVELGQISGSPFPSIQFSSRTKDVRT